MTNLLHLIGLTLPVFRLQIQNFCYSWFGKYVVAPANAFLESELFENAAHSSKRNVCVRVATKNLIQNFVRPGHKALSLTQAWMERQKQAGAFDWETGGLQSTDELFCAKPWKAGHTAMRWTPTSSMGSRGFSPSSRQSSIASRTRFMSVSIRLACV